MFLASTIILAAQTGVFAYSWFVYYGQKEVIRRDYYFWGNVVAIAQYALILLLFYKVFGAFKKKNTNSKKKQTLQTNYRE